LGEIQTKVAERVVELQLGGNRYEVYALGLAAGSLRVILREVYRDPSQVTKVSFPGKIKATRAYMRERETLRLRDESDFLMGDDDDDDDEPLVDTATNWSRTSQTPTRSLKSRSPSMRTSPRSRSRSYTPVDDEDGPGQLPRPVLSVLLPGSPRVSPTCLAGVGCCGASPGGSAAAPPSRRGARPR
jgi:hypothetical protein